MGNGIKGVPISTPELEALLRQIISPVRLAAIPAVTLAAAGDYAALDVMSNSATANAGLPIYVKELAREPGGVATIKSITARCSIAAVLASLRLHFFRELPLVAEVEMDDNAAFSLSDADAQKVVAVIPFTLADSGAATGANSFAHVLGVNAGFTCVGSADLRMLIKVKNAYVPANAEVLMPRFKIMQL